MKIGVGTRNFEFYHKLTKELRRRKINFVMLPPDKPIPPEIKVVLTTEKEKSLIDFDNLLVVREPENIDKVMRRLSKRKRYRELVIGVDPGMHPEVAVLGDGEVLRKAKLNLPENVGNFVCASLRDYEAESKLLRIGNCGGVYCNRIINAVLHQISIELVDEYDTSKRGEAAIEIARLHGREVRRKRKISPTEGEIQAVQVESRKRTGRLTIAKELAAKVAKGELSLESAIRAQKTKRNF